MKRVALAAIATGGALALAHAPRRGSYDDLARTLDTAIGGQRCAYPWRLGTVSYRVAGTGAPLLLLHGIHAAASAYDMRRNLSALSEDYTVYAPDLLGFGLSDRPPLRYSAETYVDLIGDFLRDVVGAPAHVVVSSLSSAYAVRVARRQPKLIRSLVLICPTGIEKLSGSPREAQRLVDRLLSLPGLGSWLFAALVTRSGVRYFLRSMTYHDRDQATPEVVDAYHRSGQRPGGRWAPSAFVGGRLNLDIRADFATLKQPVLLVWGKDATTTPLETAPAFLERNPRATLKVFDHAGMVPHDERAGAFNPYVRTWLKEQL